MDWGLRPGPVLARPAQQGLLLALRVFCLVLIALHLIVPLLPEQHAWGLWPFTYLPAVWRWLLAGLAALTCVPGSAQRFLSLLQAALSRTASLHRKKPIYMVARPAIIALLSLIPFTLFRIVHTRWGDAYILVNGLALPDPTRRLTATWQAPLDLWLHARLWAVGHALFGWTDAWPVYRILSPLAGALYIYVLLRLADNLAGDRTQKLLIVGLMGTLGTMQLFFGYAENYSLAAAGILLYLWLALGALRGQRPLWHSSLALAITNGLHPSTIVLDPSLLYVGWIWANHDPGSGESLNSRSRSRSRAAQALAQIALPMMAVALGVIILMTLAGQGLEALITTDRPGGGDARWFVPLAAVTTRWEHYTMFSWAHLRDWLNMQLLTAPVTLGSLLIMGYGVWLALLRRSAVGRRETGPASGKPGSDAPAFVRSVRDLSLAVVTPEVIFLALCTGLYWLFTWVWNPDYGGQRDWDLFSLAAIPSTLLLARLLPRVISAPRLQAQAALMLIAVSAMHTVAWIYQNTRPWEWT